MFLREGECSKLFIIDRDFESKIYSYSVNSYIEVLNVILPGNYNDDLYLYKTTLRSIQRIRLRNGFRIIG